MKHGRLFLAVGSPIVLAIGGWLLLRPSPAPTAPALPPAAADVAGNEPRVKPAVPQSEWPKVKAPEGNVALVPNTRPIPGGDTTEVLTVDLLKSLLAENTHAAWMRIRDLMKSGTVEDPTAVAALIVAELGKGGNDAAEGVQALALLKDPAARQRASEDLLAVARASRDSQTLRAAFEAVGELGDPRAVDALGRFARTLEDRGAVIQAMYALARIGGAASARELASLLQDRPGAAREGDVLDAIGRLKSPEMVSELKPLLSPDTPAELRLAAVKAIGRTGVKEAFAPLALVLDGADDHDLAVAALAGIGRIGSRESVEELLKIRKEGGDLGYAAGEALGNAREMDAGAAKVILSVIDQEDDDRLKISMIRGLQGSSADGVLEKFRDYVSSGEQSDIVRGYAARGLGESRDPKAVGVLAGALAASRPEEKGLRSSIYQSLLKLSQAPAARKEIEQKALPVLRRILEKTKDDKDRFWVERTLRLLEPRSR